MQFVFEARVYRLLTARFFDGVSSGMFLMALPWIMLTQGDNGVAVAMIALACTLSSFFLTPIFATMIDRYSRKSILVAVQAIQAVAALGLLISGWNDNPGLIDMAIAQFVFWVSGDLAWNTNNALTQENFEPHEYPKMSGYQEIIMQSVTLGAGGAGIILLELWDIQIFSLFATIASTIGVFFYFWMPYRRKLRKNITTKFSSQLMESKQIFARDPGFFLFLALSCLSYPALTYLVKLVPIYLAENNFQGHWFALWKSSYGVGALVCGLVIARILLRFSHEVLMVNSMLVIAGLLTLMAVFTEPLYIVSITLILGFFNALNRIARINKLNIVIDINERGRVEGGLKLFSTFSQSLSYTAIALLANYNLTEYGFALIALVMGMAALYMVRYKNKTEQLDIAVSHER